MTTVAETTGCYRMENQPNATLRANTPAAQPMGGVAVTMTTVEVIAFILMNKSIELSWVHYSTNC